jgi:hypothetical protein
MVEGNGGEEESSNQASKGLQAIRKVQICERLRRKTKGDMEGVGEKVPEKSGRGAVSCVLKSS